MHNTLSLHYCNIEYEFAQKVQRTLSLTIVDTLSDRNTELVIKRKFLTLGWDAVNINQQAKQKHVS
jgi:hypothetical protein